MAAQRRKPSCLEIKFHRLNFKSRTFGCRGLEAGNLALQDHGE